MAAHNELGKQGESLALNFLKNKKYLILEKNWRYQKAEIDIIAQKDKQIIFVEVKTRSTDFFGAPKNFINQKKINLLVLAANQYLEINELTNEVRFDIIGIIYKNSKISINHIKDAFLHF